MPKILESARIVPTTVSGPYKCYDDGLHGYKYSIYMVVGQTGEFYASGGDLDNMKLLTEFANVGYTTIKKINN